MSHLNVFDRESNSHGPKSLKITDFSIVLHLLHEVLVFSIVLHGLYEVLVLSIVFHGLHEVLS